ncbi:Ail/Lom family outer membrane beta-barrel protein [Salmonella enterica subsp. enterica serovar Bredeney]|nr:Ail/Lom family outer membrane beta-barrel protein [Salmonella enterica subsp. enterica serovar Bredeney]EHS1318695.1 Ail/Lom family outer membrane beta-barrel protein [Salmonella enterica subsp. enterica serovar Reading]
MQFSPLAFVVLNVSREGSGSGDWHTRAFIEWGGYKF